jgi:hypothetical protein
MKHFIWDMYSFNLDANFQVQKINWCFSGYCICSLTVCELCGLDEMQQALLLGGGRILWEPAAGLQGLSQRV